jgi:hypothetical protein
MCAAGLSQYAQGWICSVSNKELIHGAGGWSSEQTEVIRKREKERKPGSAADRALLRMAGDGTVW